MQSVSLQLQRNFRVAGGNTGNLKNTRIENVIQIFDILLEIGIKYEKIDSYSLFEHLFDFGNFAPFYENSKQYFQKCNFFTNCWVPTKRCQK